MAALLYLLRVLPVPRGWPGKAPPPGCRYSKGAEGIVREIEEIAPPLMLGGLVTVTASLPTHLDGGVLPAFPFHVVSFHPNSRTA